MRQAVLEIADQRAMTSSRTRAILSSTTLFGVLSLLPKLLSIGKDMAVATRFGAAEMLDAYLMAFVLIGLPVSVMVVAMQTTLIPALVGKDEDSAAGLLGGAIKLALSLLALALPVWLAMLPWTIGMLYPNSAEGARSILFEACLWLIPYYFINGANLLFYGALQARKVFWPNAALPGLFPLAMLAALWFMPQTDMRVLLVGTVAGSMLEGTALYFVLKRGGLLRWRNTGGSGLFRVLRLAVPLMAGGIIASFAPVVEQLIAYNLGPGAVSLLNYGNKVPAALNSLLLTAIGIVVLPHFAELISRREWVSCRKLYFRLSGIALGVGVLAAGIGIILAEPIIRLLFERGAFTAANSREAADAMRMYLLQLPFLLLAMLSMRVLIALEKTVTMTWITAMQLALGGALAYAISRYFGVAGVALGTAAAAMLGSILLGWAAWRRLDEQSKGLPA